MLSLGILARIRREVKKVWWISNNRNSIADSKDIFKVYYRDLHLLQISFLNIDETSELLNRSLLVLVIKSKALIVQFSVVLIKCMFCYAEMTSKSK